MKNKTVNDEEADQSLKSLNASKIIPAREFANWMGREQTNANVVSEHQERNDLSVTELKLIKAVVKHPMKPSSEYPKLAGISPNTMQKIRPKLIEKGYIREHKFQTAARGRAALLLEPLDSAKETVNGCKE